MSSVSLSVALARVLADRAKTAQIQTSPKTFFVHVRVPEHLVAQLSDVQRRLIPDTEKHQEIDHVTLVYTKKALEDHPPEKVHAALDALRRIGERTEPIEAKIQGWAYFDAAQKDGKSTTALVALLDAPGLEHLHVDMSRALKVHGVEPSDAHVFTPHITLGYLGPGARVDKPLEPLSGRFVIDKAHVAARDLHEIPLLGQSSMGKAAAVHATKHAASIAQLQAAAKRLAPIRVPTRPVSGAVIDSVGGAKTMLTTKQWNKYHALDGIKPPALGTPDNMKGQILMKDPFQRLKMRASNPSDFPEISGPARKAYNIATILHEGFERGVKPDEIAYVFSHNSPKVLMNEHNMIERMTGPGAQEAKSVFKAMRKIFDEQGALRLALMDTYGNRADRFLGPGQKIPAAMRRDFTRKMHDASARLYPYQQENFRNHMLLPRDIGRQALRADVAKWMTPSDDVRTTESVGVDAAKHASMSPSTNFTMSTSALRQDHRLSPGKGETSATVGPATSQAGGMHSGGGFK